MARGGAMKPKEEEKEEEKEKESLSLVQHSLTLTHWTSPGEKKETKPAREGWRKRERERRTSIPRLSLREAIN